MCLTPTDSVYKCVANRIARCKWARAQYWSKRNYKNDLVGALRYTMKDGNYHLLGTLITHEFLSTISPWTKCAPTVDIKKREKLSDPVLTLSNIIKQAVKFRAQTRGRPFGITFFIHLYTGARSSAAFAHSAYTPRASCRLRSLAKERGTPRRDLAEPRSRRSRAFLHRGSHSSPERV